GERADGRNLIEEWSAKSPDHTFVFDKAGFDAVDFNTDVKLLSLFEPSHMQYELDRDKDKAGEPSLAEMTKAAITRLSRDEDGYVLMIEGGRIDHAHHAGNAIRALEDAMAFDAAVAAALEMTNAEDTLIIVTADHSHTLSIAGYAQRGNPILGLSVSGKGGEGGSDGADGLPYTTLGYANGPGACRVTGKDKDGKDVLDCARQDLTGIDTLAPDFRQPALVPMYSETHGGEDVAAFASGPGANLISGVIEQNEIFHVMGRALGLVPAPPAE
ncbi:MAG: alkaline phosphatase, partial [Alphaproteobacteria bacterium]|nr:alkaline phosphatase [Alphaproteobacteria bacterium]